MKPYGKMKDNELAAAVSRGEALAGDELVRRFEDKVFRVCLCILRNHHDAQDAVQEVLFKLIVRKKIRNFRGEAQFLTWLYRITRNVCSNQIRKNRRNRRLEIMEPNIMAGLAVAQRTPEDEAVRGEITDNLRQIVSRLPDQYQEAVNTVYFKEHSYDEAARLLDIAMVTLGVHLYRGKKIIARLYGQKYLRPSEALAAA